jgi:hypothetical protein
MSNTQYPLPNHAVGRCASGALPNCPITKLPNSSSGNSDSVSSHTSKPYRFKSLKAFLPCPCLHVHNSEILLVFLYSFSKTNYPITKLPDLPISHSQMGAGEEDFGFLVGHFLIFNLSCLLS